MEKQSFEVRLCHGCEALAEHPLIESLHFPDDMEQFTRGQEGSDDHDVSQVMSGQVAANSAEAPLSAVVEGASTTTSATREISNLVTSGAASTAEGGSAVVGVARPMALTADVAVGLPVQVERPRALAEEEQRLSVEVGRAPLEQRSRLSISAGDGVANMASQALEEARSGVAGEASLRQDTSGLGAERHAGATGGQIGDAAYAAAGSALERVDAGIRSAFATPRSSQPTLRSFFGSPDGAVPSPTQLPRGLRWLEGIGSMFRGSGENQGAGSLLAPIVNMPSATYGAVAMGPRAPEGPNQQMAPFPGGARQATAGYQGVSLASLQGHMGAEQASSHILLFRTTPYKLKCADSCKAYCPELGPHRTRIVFYVVS